MAAVCACPQHCTCACGQHPRLQDPSEGQATLRAPPHSPASLCSSSWAPQARRPDSLDGSHTGAREGLVLRTLILYFGRRITEGKYSKPHDYGMFPVESKFKL